MRVGIAGLLHESNTFLPRPTVYEDFASTSLVKGEDLIERWQGAQHELGGFLEGAREYGFRPAPALAGFAVPSGALTPAQGCTQGTRPCSSSAMILSVISWYRLVRSAKDLWAGAGWGMGMSPRRAGESLSLACSARHEIRHRPFALPFQAPAQRACGP